MKNDTNKSKYLMWLSAVIWILIWFVISRIVGSDVILPSPVSTVKALLGLLKTSGFYLNVLWTVLRTVIGIVVSFAVGAILAAFSAKHMTLKEFLRLPVSFFKSIPVMAIIIYVILVVKSDWVAIVVCFLMCFPIAYTNILNGLQSIDRSRVELGRSLGLTGMQMMRYILRPALDTEIRTALGLIAAMSWKVVVASEVLAIPKFSIGYQMLNSKYYLETPDLFAYMIVLIVLSLLMEKIVAVLAALKPERLERALEREAQATHRIENNGPVTISFREVSKSFLNEEGIENPVLKDLSCEMSPGITAVLAPSGAGKTTMARLIAGFEEADSGEIKGREGARIAYLFQEDRLLPWLTVRGNMLLSFLKGNDSGRDSEEAVRRTAGNLEISETLGMMPSELSGGMAHRVALGRTLLFGGSVLILDEPFRGLDTELRGRIVDAISEELRPEDRPKTVILITHDEDLAGELADRIIRI